MKLFPRLAACGQLAEMRAQARGLFSRLAMRSLGLGVPVFALGLVLSDDVLMIAGAAALFALSASYTSLVASMQRAVGSSARLAAGTVFRAVLTLAAVVTAAHLTNLFGTLAAEAVSAIIACYLSERFFLRDAAIVPPVDDEVSQAETSISTSNWDGVRVFLTYTATSVPFYLDRIYVTATLGAEQAAEYALLALFVTAASLLVNAIAQRVGPDAIKKALKPDGAGAASRYIVGWCAISTVIWVVLLAFAPVILGQGWLPANLAKYDLDPTFLVPIGLLGSLHASVLLEFLLLALDEERRMLKAALCYLAAVVAVAGGAAIAGLDLYGLIWMLVGARMLYCGALVLALRAAFGNDKASAHA